jgi:hypothetical protein
MAVSMGLACAVAACDDPTRVGCVANVDCAGLSACVAGECVLDAAQCESIGALETVSSSRFGTLTDVEEAHVAVDANGAAHVCAYGLTETGAYDSVYLRQISSSEYTATQIAVGMGTPERCGAIAVTSDGVPFVISKSSTSALYLIGGSWMSVPLTGLEGVEAKGAVAGDSAFISLTADATGGAYLAMSLGFELESQAVYLAHLSGQSVEVIVNGWSEDGNHTSVGHAPQVISLSSGEIRAVVDDVSGFDVLFADQYLGALSTVEGVYGRAAVGPRGGVRALYLDRNYILRLDNLGSGAFAPLAQIETVSIDEMSGGEVPWEIAVDGTDASHIVYQDLNQGERALLYERVTAGGTPDVPVFVTAALSGGLPGLQRYAVGTDICGRATIADIEDVEDADAGAPRAALVVREGR